MRCNTNVYTFVDDYVEIHTVRGDVILVSDSDFERVKQHCWSVDSKGYANAGGKRLGGTVRLHRFIMGNTKGLHVDHINRNKLDNRRDNLRLVTNQQNHFNLSLAKNNKSGCTGVYYNKQCRKWCCQICHNGRCVHSELFDKKEDAVNKRHELEGIYFCIGGHYEVTEE